MTVPIYRMFWYRSRENFAKHIDDYLQGKIHFSSWQNVNDPMEGYFTYFPQHDEIGELIMEKNKYKICCFSRNYSNYLLWSHYAKDHKGVCLEYEFDTAFFPRRITRRVIKYKKVIPQFDRNEPIDKQAVQLLTHKLNFWRYEEEVRLLLYDAPYSDIKIGELKSITLGLRFMADFANHDEDLIKICNKIRELKQNQPEFELYYINNVQADGKLSRSQTRIFG